MCFIIWKDKQFVLLLSIHVPPIIKGNPISCSLPKHNRGERPLILTLPVLWEYTMKMQRVDDVANQLCGNYSWFLNCINGGRLEILKKLDKIKEAITV